MKRLFKALVAVCAMSMASGVSATVILNEVGGTLLGASNVQVGDFLYDVNFVDGSCAGLFDGCDDTSDFDFQTLDDAVAAGFALLDQVFVGRFDTNYFDTFGCGENSAFRCHTGIPFSAPPSTAVTTRVDTDFSTVVVFNRDVINDTNEVVLTDSELHGDLVTYGEAFSDINYGTPSSCGECADITNYVRFVRTGTVPEPTTTALLALGLFGVGIAARRRKVN